MTHTQTQGSHTCTLTHTHVWKIICSWPRHGWAFLTGVSFRIRLECSRCVRVCACVGVCLSLMIVSGHFEKHTSMCKRVDVLYICLYMWVKCKWAYLDSMCLRVEICFEQGACDRSSKGVKDGSVLSLLAREPQTDTHEFTNTHEFNPTKDGNLTVRFPCSWTVKLHGHCIHQG